MKTIITTQNDETCCQCYSEIPKGSSAIYDIDLFCSDDCYMEWVLECEEAEEELGHNHYN